MEAHPGNPGDPGYGDPAESPIFRSRLRRIFFDEIIESRYYYVNVIKFEARGPVVRSSWYLADRIHVWPAMNCVNFAAVKAFGSFPFRANHRFTELKGTRSQINEAGSTPFDFMTPGYADEQFRYHFYAPNTPAIDAAALREAAARAVERAERAEAAIAAATAAAAAPPEALGTIITKEGLRRSARLKTRGRSRRRETKRRRTRRRV